MRWAAMVLAVGVACERDGAPPTPFVTVAAAPAPAAAPPQALVTVRARAHQVLSARCGECHESHRDTAKPAALAVFDLDLPDWPARFDAARFEAGLRRFGAAPSADRDAFLALRDAELSLRTP